MKLLIILLLVIVGLYLLFKAFTGNKGTSSTDRTGTAELPTSHGGNLTDGSAGAGSGTAESGSSTTSAGSTSSSEGAGSGGSGISGASASGSRSSQATDSTGAAGTGAVAAGVAAAGATVAAVASAATTSIASASNAGRASSAVSSGDELYDVREMLKILNLRDGDASRLAIDKAQYNEIKAGNVSGLPDGMIAEVAGKLRKMLA